MDDKIRAIKVSQVQADELWAYCFKKSKHIRPEESNNPHLGDAYTFVSIEANSKLVLCFELGKRDGITTLRFIEKLRRATSGVFQLTCDGFKPYVGAVEEVFGSEIHFAQLVKVYSSDESTRERYSPGEVLDAIPIPITGNPKLEHISTSFAERLNLTLRMQMRRLTRLTNGFSKKWGNLEAALALMFAHYNFCRMHQSLRVSPAMQAGISDHLWSLNELISYTG